MRGVIQRVKQASVKVDSRVVGEINKGLVVLIGISPDDTNEDCEKFAAKITKLRLWPDESGSNWKKSVTDIDGQVLCVSNFTLYAKISKGTKPDFHGAAKGEHAQAIYNRVRELIAKHMPNGHRDVKDGLFGALMDIHLINDGPVTIEYDTRD